MLCTECNNILRCGYTGSYRFYEHARGGLYDYMRRVKRYGWCAWAIRPIHSIPQAQDLHLAPDTDFCCRAYPYEYLYMRLFNSIAPNGMNMVQPNMFTDSVSHPLGMSDILHAIAFLPEERHIVRHTMLHPAKTDTCHLTVTRRAHGMAVHLKGDEHPLGTRCYIHQVTRLIRLFNPSDRGNPNNRLQPDTPCRTPPAQSEQYRRMCMGGYLDTLSAIQTARMLECVTAMPRFIFGPDVTHAQMNHLAEYLEQRLASLLPPMQNPDQNTPRRLLITDSIHPISGLAPLEYLTDHPHQSRHIPRPVRRHMAGPFLIAYRYHAFPTLKQTLCNYNLIMCMPIATLRRLAATNCHCKP